MAPPDFSALYNLHIDPSFFEWAPAFGRKIEQENAFCKAVNAGDADLLQQMLAQGQDPNSVSDFDFQYMTALERAVVRCDPRLIKILLDAGADPKENKFNGLIVTWASYHGKEQEKLWPGFRPNADGEFKPVPGLPGLLKLSSETRPKAGTHRTSVEHESQRSSQHCSRRQLSSSADLTA
jgi:hypothetical protein